jgi:putative transposase
VNHFGAIIAAELRKRRPKPHSIWHLDEVYVKIDGRMLYRKGSLTTILIPTM